MSNHIHFLATAEKIRFTVLISASRPANTDKHIHDQRSTFFPGKLKNTVTLGTCARPAKGQRKAEQ